MTDASQSLSTLVLSRLQRLDVRAPATEWITGHLKTISDNKNDREFLPAHLEILESPPSPYAMVFLWVVGLMMACALLWSTIARIDIYAVATGRVQPSGRSKVVQTFETATVQNVLVENGARVHAGTPLVDLDAKDADAELSARRSELGALDAQIARHQATIEAVRDGLMTIEPKFANVDAAIEAQERATMQADIVQYGDARNGLLAQIDENGATQRRLSDSIAARQRLQALLQERAGMKQALAEELVGTRAAVIDASQQVEQAATDLAHDQGQLAETLAAAASMRQRMAQFASDTVAKHHQALAEAIEKRAVAIEQVLKAGLRRERMHLSSPIEGTVQQLAVTTVGQVVTAGQPLLVVVPSQGSIEIEALVANRDIGFIVPGQKAVVKVDAFPFTRYGTIAGTVTRVSRDATNAREAGAAGDALMLAKGQGLDQAKGTPELQDLVYSVTIKLERTTIFSNGRPIPLTPGMGTSVDIQTGNRRVIDYVLAPIKEIASTAGHER